MSLTIRYTYADMTSRNRNNGTEIAFQNLNDVCIETESFRELTQYYQPEPSEVVDYIINQYDAKSLAAAIHLSGRGEVVAKILNELYFRRVA
ncbi:hypothetical protein I4574_16755 [Proteus mirabilis]|uniref:Uncharacterized protein n=1 Tax=Proteus mirabilis TaxID=584 RepID=A0AAN1EVG2_PROMI|nr:hypothetical protein [Proteus mirabilis]ARX34722.1 hypothetical protein AM402_11415 [Proteus mirabilis]ELA7950959.1 hypothetical protein [Proteus mirabilis]MBG2779426.1 hypothetical protein [Proteus mirabilis]